MSEKGVWLHRTGAFDKKTSFNSIILTSLKKIKNKMSRSEFGSHTNNTQYPAS